jgi:hypothetical protein
MKLFTFIREWWEERKYPEDVKELIRIKRKKIRSYKKKIKSSIKNGGTDHTIKHYRYLARKAKKELEGIKEHFKNKI